MSEPFSFRRGFIVALSGLVTVTTCYFAFRQYTQTISPPKNELHRSNAIRRRRRRWRNGTPQVNLDYNPTDRALEHLAQREQARHGYGRYMNAWMVDASLAEAHREDFLLLPSSVELIYSTILESRTLTGYEKEQLRFHIHGLCVQHFLQEEYPDGYIIGDDAQRLANAMCPPIDRLALEKIAEMFDHGKILPDYLAFEPEPTPDPVRANPSNTDAESFTVDNITQALGGNYDNDEDESYGRRSYHGTADDQNGQNVLDLLYRIAEEQAKRAGYKHRGVECNGCGMQPIDGIRYHCANCWDYDLCESCEAQQIHIKTHVFYKIRIPVPTRGQIKRVQPKWYPGNPNACRDTVPSELRDHLRNTAKVDRQETDALYVQFKCIAGHPWPDDPWDIGMAINRINFDAYFTTTGQDRPPPPNLIFDRIFCFYDYNDDGLIGFEEFVRGMAELTYDDSRHARLRRMFVAFDLDGDGYVDRKDFLRMLRAHYALSRELTRELIYTREDSALAEEEVREAVHGSHPISAAFGGSVFASHVARRGQGKTLDVNGDLQLDDETHEVLQADADLTGDRLRAIGNSAVRNHPRRHPLRSFRAEDPVDEPIMVPGFYHPEDDDFSREDEVIDEDLNGSDPTFQIYGWPPLLPPETEDIVNALGAEVPLDEIMDPVDRSRVCFAQSQRMDEESDKHLNNLRKGAIDERWHRKQFYIDEEEGMTKPPGYTEPDSSDDEAPEDVEPSSHVPKSKPSSRRPSLRSRSSSKVRFDDSAIDTDYETRSDVSSRSIPVNERWGGFELSEPEKDVGKEIIYQALQQSFIEMLHPVFKAREDEAMEAATTRASRTRWASVLKAYKTGIQKLVEEKDEALRQADLLRTQELISGSELMEDDTGRTKEFSSITITNSLSNNSSTESFVDPTLPQNRPNELPAPSKSPAELEPEPPPEATLKLWLKHEKIDAEAIERGGYGKLNFKEFKRIMKPDLGTKSQTLDNTLPGRDAEEDDRYWEESADLGQLSFLASWLEMGKF